MNIRSAAALTVGLCMTTGGMVAADPAPQDIDARLAALLGQEHAALGAVDRDHVERILTPANEAGGEESRFDAAWLRSLPKPDGGEELDCLANALYFEARGEGIRGQFAVAEVILNRVESASYPDSICGVVYQGAAARHACQFSFACDGRPESVGERTAYSLAERIAHLMTEGAPRELTGGATHFHTHAVSPRWSQEFPRTAQIGAHIFYRQPVQVSSVN